MESPTYYHSLSPVLQSLKQFDMESFPLQEEIVYARHASELPSYLKKATFETAIVCSPENTCTESPGNAPEEGEILGASELASQLLEANGQQSLQETEVNDCVSSEDVISSTCDERNNNKCNVKEKFTLEAHSVKPVLNIFRQREETQPKDNPAEQMDTNCTPENSLHSKVEQSADEESHLQGKLGGRMNVERFLETFNSSSVSSLEVSQRKALIHVLKHKLAIIQGEFALY